MKNCHVHEASSALVSPDGSPASASQDEVDVGESSPAAPRALARSHAFQGVKRPRGVHGLAQFLDLEAGVDSEGDPEGDSSDEEEEVDLAVYFAGHNLDPQTQIGICRTYANYLAALVRKRVQQREQKSKEHF